MASLAADRDRMHVTSDNLRLWLRLLSTSTAIEKNVRRRLIDRHGTTLPRFDLLAALDRYRAGLSMSALSRFLLVSNGNITNIVKTLENEGMVAVAPDPEDKRVSRVVITPSGIAAFANLAEAHHDWIDAMFAGISESDRTHLYDLLGRLKQLVMQDKTEDEL